MKDTIACPKCGQEIEVTEVLSAQLTTQIRKEMEADVAGRKKELDDQSNELAVREKEIKKAQESISEQVQTQLAGERKKLEYEAKQKAEESLAVDLKDKDEQITEYKSKLKTANETELTLRKKERELETRTEALELEVTRKIDEERGKIREAAKKQSDDDHALKDAEKEKQIADMRTKITELQRKAEQGSQQLQGEVLELSLEGFLRDHFPLDQITPVPKGIHGGDVLQHVRDASGMDCGLILWESKRTKRWSDGWLAKLRDDQRAAKAIQSVILTETMPADCETFTRIDGVWITNRPCLLGVATSLRATVVELAKASRAIQGKESKMEVLYDYLAGSEFLNRIQGIVEGFVTMRDELEAEKRSTQRMWAKREKQLDRVLVNTSGFYGDLQGIIGGGLAQIEALELPALESPSVDDEG